MTKSIVIDKGFYLKSSTSCVNKEVINYNIQLREAIEPHPNVKLLEIELSR